MGRLDVPSDAHTSGEIHPVWAGVVVDEMIKGRNQKVEGRVCKVGA